jgi:cytoskeletal protein RodZ
MSTFGEDLRMARMARGIALEDITAVTKISLHHLQALEQERFRQLPGGILNKGIVRGYATAVGLEPQDWTDRFLKAYEASGQVLDDDRDWMAFASNVGRARMQRREQAQFRLKWVGAFLLVLLVSTAVFLAVRYYGVRAGWWPTVIPENHVASALHMAYSSTVQWVERLFA